MRQRFFAILLLVFAAALVAASPRCRLYPEAKGAKARVTLTPYFADSAKNTGIGIIVCPGGSYSWHNTTTESVEVARWLTQEGINAFVLQYRVATVAAFCTGFRVLGFGNKYPDMLEDAEAALAYLHTHADSLCLRHDRIGIMGFSAGGHLAMLSATLNRTDCRPAFVCAAYPVVSMTEPFAHRRSRRGALGVWGQFNTQMRDSLSLERHIAPDCPPVFLFACQDDPVVDIRNSRLLDSALTAARVEHTYLELPSGGHGFGAGSSSSSAVAEDLVSGSSPTGVSPLIWKNQFLSWISNIFQLKK